MNLTEIAENVKYLISNFDPWIGTPFEGYKYLDSKQKGNFGENFVESYFKSVGSKVTPADNAGHDRIVDGVKVEVKFSLAHSDNKKKIIKDNTFTMNHVSADKDWEVLVFFGINPDIQESYTRVLTKSQFRNILSSKDQKLFSRQQGGKKIENDDWMSADKRLLNLLENMTEVSEWKEIIKSI